MIKLVCAVSRKETLTPDGFRDYWLNRHGPIVAGAARALKIRKYVQSHRVDHPANEALRAVRGMRAPLDGIAELWWDSLSDMLAAAATPEGAEAGRSVREDEENFVDFGRSSAFLTEEHPVFDRTGGAGLGPEAVKVTYLLARKDGMSPAECHATWLDDHGQMAAGFAEISHLARYVQSHTIASEANEMLRASRGFAPPLDGMTVIWLNSASDLKRGVETANGRAAAAALAEDERRFVQLDRSYCFITREHLIFDDAC
ncbi:EthD domain-containing protein [Sphingobium sp. EM0848]|uniref:EthD domain-containing protein n=1 Tax=Sphingobium sp. EM0848 TaxID=2743473 RepID=UPI00159C6E78|nr:EthD domain-containing protein [Sphingobium sp. EM0848]